VLPFLSPKGAAYPSPGHRSCEKIPWKSKSISRRDAKPQRHKENNAVDLSESLRLGVSARDCLFFHGFIGLGYAAHSISICEP
jgi:hypothetical protein